jgi:pyruvate kinase
MNNQLRRTKIVATIGPSSDSYGVLRKMVAMGMNVARLNFSHGNYAYYQQLIKKIHLAAKAENKNVAIMQDLQGPRIRVGHLSAKGLKLNNNEIIVFVPEHLAGRKLKLGKIIPHQYEQLSKLVKKKQTILLADGQIEARVIKKQKKLVYAKVIVGGILTTHQGINIPQVKVPEPALTKKDIKDLKFALSKKVDFIALSFVKSAKDIHLLKKLIKKYCQTTVQPKIIAKIECRGSVDNFQEILQAADGIMVARGDLGVELPPEQVPLLQKTFIKDALLAAKPVIVATQMLESMTKKPRPTRAEVSDVANAVIDHADAVMLSGESANGSFPVESVNMMTRIIKVTEKSPLDDLDQKIFNFSDKLVAEFGVFAEQVNEVSRDIKAQAIVVLSSSGLTARLIARYRPQTNIIALVSNDNVKRQLELVWGVKAYKFGIHKSVKVIMNYALNKLKNNRLVKKGDHVLVVSGRSIGKVKQNRLLEVVTI